MNFQPPQTRYVLFLFIEFELQVASLSSTFDQVMLTPIV